mmetsp:Transcript_57971/g.160202  ORF Transcript_57971/g.160202 Transcript_57971/m.160202 type:complete len:101 (-) Transcript_57971:191-493(-)
MTRLPTNGRPLAPFSEKIIINSRPPCNATLRGTPCGRWHAMSIWRTNLINQVIMIMYVYFGYTPAQIYGIYYGTTKGSGADSPKTKVASKTGAGESTKAE